MKSREFMTRFSQLIERAEGVGLRVPEDSALIGLAADLVPQVTRLLRDGVELLRTVEEHYGRLSAGESAPVSLGREESDTVALREIGSMISSIIAIRELTDLAFFAHVDVQGALDQLLGSATRKHPLWVATSCEAGLRRLRKALVSVESALYEFEEMEAPERRWLDVEVSLEIRRLYANLRRETLERPDDAELEDRLRAVLYRTIAFRELRIYPFLRVDDRVHLRQLLSRIVDWLNSGERDANAGRRLWQDLVGFTEILAQVSQRQELQEHDRALLLKVQKTLFGEVASAEVPASLLAELQVLQGLDEELDGLIGNSVGSAERWRRPVDRLLESLAAKPLSSPSSGRLLDAFRIF